MNTSHIINGLLLIMLCSCGKDSIETYKIPKQPASLRGTPEITTKTPKIGFEADLPETWQVIQGSGMRVVSYNIDGTEIDFYAIKLGMGDLVSNVNRWRSQIGLEEHTLEEISEYVIPLMASGAPVNFVELYNSELDKGILAAIVDTKPTYWYFTAKGSIKELRANSSDIQRFINSIRFD